MPTTTPLTDAIEALTTYSNTVTGASDQTLSDAVATLAAGYGGGGLPSNVLSAQGLINDDYGFGYISSDAAPTYSDTGVSGIYISPGANRVQVAYVRYGPIDLTNISAINAGTRVSASGTNYHEIFIDTGTNARAYDILAIDPDRVHRGTGNNNSYIMSSLNVSAYTGEYYVYVGTDSDGESWVNSRNIYILGVTMTEST